MTPLEKPLAVAALTKNNTEQVRVTLQEYKGLPLCDVRVFGKFSAAQTYMPTGKGIAINVALLPDLISALQNAEAKAKDLGLLIDGKG